MRARLQRHGVAPLAWSTLPDNSRGLFATGWTSPPYPTTLGLAASVGTKCPNDGRALNGRETCSASSAWLYLDIHVLGTSFGMLHAAHAGAVFRLDDGHTNVAMASQSITWFVNYYFLW